MKREVTTTRSLAALAILSTALAFSPAVTAQQNPPAQPPQNPPAQAPENNPAAQPPENTPQSPETVPQAAPAAATAAAGETMDMVSARVALKQTVDARKMQPGDQIHTTLAKTVHLKNGTELPAGTAILGVVGTDDMQMNGASKLALKFNAAQTKDGKTIPIKATIIEIVPPATQDINGRPLAPGDQELHTWVGHPAAVDQLEAIPGADLHSNVTSSNSGVLVSSKQDIKLKWGSEIALAVEPLSGE